MELRDLTIKDMEGVEIKGAKTLFDVLATVAERAKQVLVKHEAAQRVQEANTYKKTYTERKRDRSAVSLADGGGEGSTAATTAAASSSAKRNRCNNFPNNKKNTMGNGPEPPPPLPQEFKNKIQEMAQGKHITEERLVIQKGLFDTDVSRNHNRLSIPMSRISDDFLTEEEKARLCSHDQNNKKNYLEVEIIDPLLIRDDVKFGRWDMPKNNGKTSSCYVINGNWKRIVSRNGLKPGVVLQLWGFRIDQKLWFALVRLPKNPTDETA